MTQDSDDIALAGQAVSLVLDCYGRFLNGPSRVALVGLSSRGAGILDHPALIGWGEERDSPLDRIDFIRARNKLGNAVFRLLVWCAEPAPDFQKDGILGRDTMADYLTARIVPRDAYRIGDPVRYNVIDGLLEKGFVTADALFNSYFLGRDCDAVNAVLAGDAARHLTDAQMGADTAIAPRQYVTDVFDHYAENFDSHLVEKLSYAAPELIGQALDAVAPEGRRFQNVLDLGCGTGLIGAGMRAAADHLTGIDLSARMLAEAKKKAIYDDLVEDDIADYLRGTGESFDLFLAGDVFIYLGDPRPVFEAARARATPGALFALTTESDDNAGYRLNPSGRYSHNAKLIREIATTCGARERHHKAATLRTEYDAPVLADIFVFEF